MIINISISVSKSKNVILCFKIDLDYVNDRLNLTTNLGFFIEEKSPANMFDTNAVFLWFYGYVLCKLSDHVKR